MNDPQPSRAPAPWRRLAFVRCSLKVLSSALFPQDTDRLQKIITNDLPPDAKILRIRQDWDDELAGVVQLLIESSEFDEVPDGHRIPERDITFSVRLVASEASGEDPAP